MFKEDRDIRIETVLDKFNSEHFGLQMGNMNADPLVRCGNRAEMAQAVSAGLKAAQTEGFQHLTCRVKTSEKSHAAALTGNGFQIADTLVTYCFWFGESRPPLPEGPCTLADCREEDIPLLKKVARASFKIDRFHSDPALSDEKCDEYYEKWFENSCHGFADKVLAAHWHGTPVGFATGKRDKDGPFVHMGLIAVSPDARGFGSGAGMEAGILRWAWELAAQAPGIKGFLHGTQIDNVAMQKILIRMGFVPYKSEYVFQRTI